MNALGQPYPNGIPDLLDEARWGLDWMLKLHPAPDQLYHQVADDRDHTGAAPAAERDCRLRLGQRRGARGVFRRSDAGRSSTSIFCGQGGSTVTVGLLRTDPSWVCEGTTFTAFWSEYVMAMVGAYFEGVKLPDFTSVGQAALTKANVDQYYDSSGNVKALRRLMQATRIWRMSAFSRSLGISPIFRRSADRMPRLRCGDRRSRSRYGGGQDSSRASRAEWICDVGFSMCPHERLLWL